MANNRVFVRLASIRRDIYRVIHWFGEKSVRLGVYFVGENRKRVVSLSNFIPSEVILRPSSAV